MVATKALHRILMCRPTYFTVAYEINPWMKRQVTVDGPLASKQWENLKTTLETNCEASIELVEPVRGFPDMVFTANAALIWKNRAYLSHFKHNERQGEREYFKNWFLERKFKVLGDERLSFEGAGDALFAGDKLFAAYGYRTDKTIYGEIKRSLKDNDQEKLRIILCQLIDPHFYHIDTCFCPLNSKLAMWNPYAFSPESRTSMENEIELLAVPKNEAENFACNSVVVEENVVLPARCPETKQLLEKRGFRTHSVNVSEFLKAGGACKCLTLAL
uniref:Amidinotransferase n=1 Tax=Romanomermis culicivorax TaxID=13658 RepID=A0A915KF74_ROMCU